MKKILNFSHTTMRILYLGPILVIVLSGSSKSGASNSENNLGSGDNWDFWWTYSGISGPSYWGLLNPDWSVCHKGQKQSPIDIDPESIVFDRNLKPLRTDNRYMSGLMYNDGHAIIFSVEKTYANNKNNNKDNSNDNNNTYVTNGIIAQNQNANQQQQQQQQQSLSSSSSSDASVKSISVGLANQPSVNQYSVVQEVGKDLLSVLSVSTVSSLSSDQIPIKQLDSKTSLLVSPSSISQSIDYESIDDKVIDGLDGVNGKQSGDDLLGPRDTVEFSGAGLAYTYRLSMLFMRFGLENNHGSEHRIATKSFVAEIQIIAYNNKLYKDYQEASTRPSGLLAVSILIDVNKQAANTTTSESLNILIENAKRVNNRGKQVQLEHFDVGSLLTDPLNFITYEGSLTYPGCHETVTWILLNRPLYITESQLNDLRQISADETSEAIGSGNMIANNFRAPQPLNERLIRASISHNQDNSDTCNKMTVKYEYSYKGSHKNTGRR